MKKVFRSEWAWRIAEMCERTVAVAEPTHEVLTRWIGLSETCLVEKRFF